MWDAVAVVAALLVAPARTRAGVSPLVPAGPVDVFISGTEGYPCYRIPAVLRLPSGTILLFAEGRRGGDTGPNDIVYKTSKDDGVTWSALQVLHSEWEPPGHGWHTLSKNATWNATHVWAANDGFFAAGHDWIPPANVTFADAEAKCSNNSGCVGFSFFDYDPRPTKPVKTYFKAPGARFTPTHGSGQCIHNPCPVLANGRALVVFGRNRHQLLAMRALDDEATRWGPVHDLTPMLFNTTQAGVTPGPGAGIAFPTTTGTRLAVALSAPFGAGTGGGAMLSDDDGRTWRLSARANPKGGEAQIAVAQNGSLLLDSRGPVQGVRWESWSHDGGDTWTMPLVSDYGFGSSCQGSVVRDGASLLFAHPGRIGNKFNRWNISVWRSTDSGASWQAIEQIEHFNATELPHLHTAYSALLSASQGSGRVHGFRSGATEYALAYERGPMPGSHIVPSQCGEYATIRWHHGAPQAAQGKPL